MVAAVLSEGGGESEGRTADVLTEEIRGLHDAMVACHAALLGVVSEYDEQRLFEADGAHSMGDWLTLSLGVSGATGRDWARTARRLADLPAVTEAFSDGDLSYDQTRVLARFVPSEEDEVWAEQGPRHSVDDLARIARKAEPVTPAESQDVHARRRLDWYWDSETRTVKLKGLLPEEDGQTLVNALERIVDGHFDAERSSAGPQERIPYAARMADALVELAGLRIGADADPDRATILIQISAAALTNTDGSDGVLGRDVTHPNYIHVPTSQGGWIEGGPALSAETIRRLGCDCRYQTVTFDEYGLAIGLGRTQRSVPPPLARAIRQRDGTCRWPGCSRTRRLRIHHLIFWANGGRTDSDNCCALCARHHRLLHEAGFQITGNANTELTFKRPDGTLIGTSRPPPA